MLWDTTKKVPTGNTNQSTERSNSVTDTSGARLRYLGRAIRAHLIKSDRRWQRFCRKANICTKCCASILILLVFSQTDSYASISPAMKARIVNAIYLAEGGEKAKKPYGVLSIACETDAECKRICENTVENNFKRWLKTDKSKPFLVFLRDRYAPVQAHKLNRNWLKNVEMHLYGGAA